MAGTLASALWVGGLHALIFRRASAPGRGTQGARHETQVPRHRRARLPPLEKTAHHRVGSALCGHLRFQRRLEARLLAGRPGSRPVCPRLGRLPAHRRCHGAGAGCRNHEQRHRGAVRLRRNPAQRKNRHHQGHRRSRGGDCHLCLAAGTRLRGGRNAARVAHKGNDPCSGSLWG